MTNPIVLFHTGIKINLDICKSRQQEHRLHHKWSVNPSLAPMISKRTLKVPSQNKLECASQHWKPMQSLILNHLETLHVSPPQRQNNMIR